MRRIRVIPVLLVQNGGLVKTVKFKKPTYLGDPLNAVKIFNDKEVDEIAVLDISATPNNKPPDLKFIAELAGECFMPLTYGGGITSLEEIKKLFNLGVEKVCINSAAIADRKLIADAASMFGSQSIMISIDVKLNLFGQHRVYSRSGSNNTGYDPVKFAVEMEQSGAGELFVNSIDRDGTYTGYDTELIGKIAHAVKIPVIACGGASSVDDFQMVIKKGASAVAAGSMFVFHGPHKAVLINFPSQQVLKEKLYSINNA